MPKIIIGVWIYLCGVLSALIAGAYLSQIMSVFPESQLTAYGPRIPNVSQTLSAWLPNAPAALWLGAALSALAGLYLWRSSRPLETRLFAAAVIAALNLFLAMFFTSALLVAYFYLPKVANGV